VKKYIYIYVVAMEALRKRKDTMKLSLSPKLMAQEKERQDETPFTTKIDGFPTFNPFPHPPTLNGKNSP
jgi:hypothetical protein